MRRQIKIAIILLITFSVLTGIIYPLVVTGIAQLAFNHQANGSLIQAGGNNVGSELIGQPFSDPKYFWGRLSATAAFPYDASSSSGSNYAQSNPAWLQAVQARIDALKAADPNNIQPVPVDLVTFSASGLDPQISLAAAQYQVARVARVRGLSLNTVSSLLDANIRGRQLGILGEQTVNVLELNLALDKLK